MFVETLIIGNGFAGRAVASRLEGDFLIVDRGEVLDIFERRRRFMEMKPRPNLHHSVMIRDAYASRHDFNRVEKLSPDCRSDYILVDGGCSNHWGGLSFRLSRNVFSDRGGDFAWPFPYEAVEPHYDEAEELLRICADSADPDGRNALAEIKGAAEWRRVLSPFFPQAYLGAQAHNLASDGANDQGICLGAGDCELCPMDAKTRSAHIRADARVLNGVMVDRLRFEKGKAVEALCVTEDGPLTIGFDRVVVAAHGVESLKLLVKSNLPAATPSRFIGHHYQDHAIEETACILKGVQLPYGRLNTASQVVIPELSGERDGIEYTTLGLANPPFQDALAGAVDLDKVNAWDLEGAIRDIGATLGLFILLEIPPEWNVSIGYRDGKVSVDSAGYHRNKRLYGRIVEDIHAGIESLGAVPIRSAQRRHYMHWFGTHHIVGTLGMGTGPQSVVDPDFRLKGTDNVFVAGSSLFPRCGSRNPTVTVVALGLMLADRLNARTEGRA